MTRERSARIALLVNEIIDNAQSAVFIDRVEKASSFVAGRIRGIKEFKDKGFIAPDEAHMIIRNNEMALRQAQSVLRRTPVQSYQMAA